MGCGNYMNVKAVDGRLPVDAPVADAYEGSHAMNSNSMNVNVYCAMAHSPQRRHRALAATGMVIALISPLAVAMAQSGTLSERVAPIAAAMAMGRWDWLRLALVVAVAAIAGRLARRSLGALLLGLAKRTSSDWDDFVVDRIAGPLGGAATLVILSLSSPLLVLTEHGQAMLSRGIRAAFVAVLFWTIWRIIDVVRLMIARSAWAEDVPSSRALLPLGARVFKVAILAIAAATVLSLFGFPVASLLAGLGIGGLALALAAQKTVENLFGSFSIAIDQPFREGDFVKVDDFVGTVERIGLRSTRFRTLDRTIVSLPNGKLADMRLESFTERDRMRLSATIGLVYETSGSQMREVLAGIERVLREHPLIWPDAVVVRFSALASSSLDIEVMAWFRTREWSEFQLVRQDLLLQFIDVVTAAGTAFAFPTQTIHVASRANPVEETMAGVDAPRV
jgi:MscS family membrane protein